MILINQKCSKTYDINAKFNGLIQTKSLILYQKMDESIPTIMDESIPTIINELTPPFLMIEKLSEKTFGGIKVMDPISVIKITKKQEKFFEEYFGKGIPIKIGDLEV